MLIFLRMLSSHSNIMSILYEYFEKDYTIELELSSQVQRFSKMDCKISISFPLEKRPLSAQRCSRFGHWEADTVLAKQKEHA